MNNSLEYVGVKKKILSFSNFEMWELRVVDLKLKGSISKERHVGYSFKNVEDKIIHIVKSEYKEEDISLGEVMSGEYIELSEIKKLVKSSVENKYTLPEMSSDEIESMNNMFDDNDCSSFYQEFIEPLSSLYNADENTIKSKENKILCK